MNYQPFYDMHVLVSDDLLTVLSNHPIAITAFIFLALCLPFLSVLTVVSFIRYFFFKPDRIYPAHTIGVLNND